MIIKKTKFHVAKLCGDRICLKIKSKECVYSCVISFSQFKDKVQAFETVMKVGMVYNHTYIKVLEQDPDNIVIRSIPIFGDRYIKVADCQNVETKDSEGIKISVDEYSLGVVIGKEESVNGDIEFKISDKDIATIVNTIDLL